MKAAYRTTLLTALAVVALGACSRPALQAGHYGGRAFIVFTAMLVITAVIMFLAMGRED